MNMHPSQNVGYFTEDACSIDDFRLCIDRETRPADVPYAASIDQNIPIYDTTALADDLKNTDKRQDLMLEWARTLKDGAGVVVLKDAATDHDAIDKATAIFDQIIADERASGANGADHFAKTGANDRIWNSLEKLCLADPQVFAHYHALPIIDAACEAWLGPNYQMTAQVNLVRPGGNAQDAHRDYHLGFMSADQASLFPAHVHALSPVLTLQGGIAHVDVPVEAGPTKLLPFSQTYLPGYMAWRRKDFRGVFEERFVQLPLKKGDALFFNPALFHAGGENRTADIQRLLNLFQVSSPLGRAMETVDRAAMCKALYPALQTAKASGALSDLARKAVIAACAEGYAFPTSLDTDPPVDGLAPRTQADLMRACLSDDTSAHEFSTQLDAQEAKRRTR